VREVQEVTAAVGRYEAEVDDLVVQLQVNMALGNGLWDT